MATSIKEDQSEPPPDTSLPLTINKNNDHMLKTDHYNPDASLDLLDAKTVSDDNHCSIVGKKLKTMLDGKVMCDLLLRLGKSEHQIFTHKCILAANSSSLYNSIQLAEKDAREHHSPYLSISIDTDCIEAFESLLHFMYTGELLLNPHIIEEVIDLSRSLYIGGVLPLCSIYLQGLIDINNWMWLNNVVKKYNFGKELHQKLKQFANENFAFLVQSNEMISLDKETLINILTDCNSQNDYDVEAIKLEMILKWLSFSNVRLVELTDLMTCLKKDLFHLDDLQKIRVTYDSIICQLDQEIWKPFVTTVRIIQEDLQKRKVKEQEEISLKQDQELQVNDLDATDKKEKVTLNAKVETEDDGDNLDDGFESDNTLPYEKGHDSDRELVEENDKFVKKIRLKVEPNQSIEYIEEPPIESKRRNKRKASYPVKLNVPKKKCKNVKPAKSKTKSPKTSGAKAKRPKTKSSCTQVCQDEIQEEFEEIAEEEKKKKEEDDEKKKVEEAPLPILVKAELDLDDTIHDGDEDNDFGAPDFEDDDDEEEGEAEVIKVEPEDPDSTHQQIKVKIIRRERKAPKKPLKDLFPDIDDKKKPFKTKTIKSGATVYVCPIEGCTYHAFRPGRLKDHLEGHSGKRRHVCVVCNKTFAMLHYLQRHKKIHTGKTVPCELCTYSTCRSDKLRLHYKACHPAEAVEKGYMTQDSFDKKVEEKAKKALLPKKPRKPRRRRIPPGEEIIYSCERCPRKFSTPSALKHHIKGHGANQPFLCEVCGFKTIHFASMNVHKRQHNENLRFRCTWPGCNYTAIRRSRLDDHMCTHQGIKNHVCSVCGKAFAGRKHLHRHEQLHKGEKLRCAECPYESPRRDKLRDHIKKHHPATAIMHGFLTQEDLNKPKPPPKPRKPRPSRSKKKPTTEVLIDSVDHSSSMAAMQLKEERFTEDRKAAESIDQDDSMPTNSAAAAAAAAAAASQIPPGYIQLPPHLFPGSGAVSEEVIQYITSMSAHHQQQQGIHIPPHHSMGQSIPPHDNMVGEPSAQPHNLTSTALSAQPHNLTSTALSVPPAAHSQPTLSADHQQHWGYYQL